MDAADITALYDALAAHLTPADMQRLRTMIDAQPDDLTTV